MAKTFTEKDYQAYGQSLANLSPADRVMQTGKDKARFEADGYTLDNTLLDKYVNTPNTKALVGNTSTLKPITLPVGSGSGLVTGPGVTAEGGSSPSTLKPDTASVSSGSGLVTGPGATPTASPAKDANKLTVNGDQVSNISLGSNGSSVSSVGVGPVHGSELVTGPGVKPDTASALAPALTRKEVYTKFLEDQATGTSDLVKGGEFDPKTQTVQNNELLATNITTQDVAVTAGQAATSGLKIAVPQKTSAAQYEAQTVENSPEAIAAQGKLSSESKIGDIAGAVSQTALAEAAQGVVSEKATVKYQLGELYKSFEEGTPPPAWAAPAIRNVGALMSQRGLGASSMAAAAITQSIMESGIPIAQADAATYATVDLANLNNRQQSALTNAATYAAMDRVNLDNRMKAAVANAQSFLSMDVTNLNNKQTVVELNHQAEVQTMFTDQAAENVALQFSAQSQQQTDQFFSELEVQVANANSNRFAAQSQFNTNEKNAMDQFKLSMNDARERFETQLRVQIDQSNTQWRRDINTANTAIENEANRINTQNLLNISSQAQNNLWQRYRDESAWIFQMSENATQREHQIGMLALEFGQSQEAYDKQLEDQTAGELGKAAINILFGQ